MTRRVPIIRNEASGASGASLLAARLCLAAVFLYSGATKLVFRSDGIAEFAALGWRSGLAALALAAFTIAATLVGHPFRAFEGVTVPCRRTRKPRRRPFVRSQNNDHTCVFVFCSMVH